MVIDFHTHCFPEKIAAKAVEKLARTAGIMYPRHDGTPDGLEKMLTEGGANKGVVLNIATNPHQQRAVNDFAISLLKSEKLVPFGSVHPDSDDIDAELERLAAAGIKGVKFHPEYQNFYVDDDRMLPVYEKIGKLGLITVFHSGFDLGYRAPFHCTPERLGRILGAFGGAPVVAAHLGGVTEYEDTMKYLCGTEIHLDTGFTCGTVPTFFAKDIIAAHSADRVLLGSDAPWLSTKESVAYVDCLDLSDDDRAKILGGNGFSLLYGRN